jgi:hypothetical protein
MRRYLLRNCHLCGAAPTNNDDRSIRCCNGFCENASKKFSEREWGYERSHNNNPLSRICVVEEIVNDIETKIDKLLSMLNDKQRKN